MDQPGDTGCVNNEAFYQFNTDSALRTYLVTNGRSLGGAFSRCFRMDRLIFTLTEVLKEQEMITRDDPGMIICSEQFTQIMGPRAMHVKQLGIYCAKHTTLLPPEDQMVLMTRYPMMRGEMGYETGELTMQILDMINLKPNTRFYIDPRIREIFDSELICHKNVMKFTYDQVMRLFRMYCISRELIDLENPEVAIIKGDPMADLLKRSAVHENQICYLLARFVACTNCWTKDGIREVNEDEMDGPGF
jgi:hypothetical protein